MAFVILFILCVFHCAIVHVLQSFVTIFKRIMINVEKSKEKKFFFSPKKTI